mmetsp:Transcript_11311/g.27239  ORF Transcript_11311/g.27239 Transcript_11311/m.27239 type:complete len:291 (+) Transcript_11311:107-979(+)
MPFAQPDNGRQGGVGDPQGPDDWFKSLPIVTRYWFGATMLVTLTVNFQIISPYKIMFDWESLKGSLELWRLLTPFCYAGPFDFGTLIGCYMLVQFSKQYEKGGPFNTGAGGGTADYVFCMMFGTIGMLLSYPVLMPILSLPPVFCRNLTYYVLYIWSKRNPTANANIWGFPIKAIYLPFAYLAMTVFMGQGYMDMLHGIAIGHFYYFLVDVFPVVYGKDVLHTPAFLIDTFGIGEYTPPAAGAGRPVGGGGGGGVTGFGGRAAGGQAPAAARPAGGGHTWGSGGQRLGTQ